MRTASRGGKADLLTGHAVPSFAALWLMPRLACFTQSNPDIDLRLNASTELIDLADGAVDFDIRYGHVLAQAGVVVEELPKETIVALCPPKLCSGRAGIRGTRT